MTVQEAADYLGVGRKAIQRMIARGDLDAEPSLLDRRRRLIAVEQLDVVRAREGLGVR